MSYHPLRVHPNTPSSVVALIRDHLDMQFHDVHVALRLPLPNSDKSGELDAGLNFMAADWLSALIGGISTVFYSQEGGSGYRFKAVLQEYYPWDIDGEPKPKRGSKILYQTFRNPLVHALGLETRKEKRKLFFFLKRVVSLLKKTSRNAKVDKYPLTEQQIEEIEKSLSKPSWLPKTLDDNSGDPVLFVPSLYWGVREMVYRLTADQSRMDQTERFLVRR